jgi:multiple sugar transport system substrate-binding protein
MPRLSRRIHIEVMCIAISAIALMVACAPHEPVQTATIPPTATPTLREVNETPATITWAYWGDPWEVEINERVVAVFEKDYPHIEVQTLHEPWTTYFDEIEVWWASDSPPDVLFLEFIPLYAARGFLEDLTPYLERDEYGLDDFYPGLIDSFMLNDSLYGLPRDNDTKVIYYNKALFDEAGVPYPVSGWNWEDLRRTAIQLTKRVDGVTTQYGFAYEPDEWWRLWVWQNGGEVYDDDFGATRTLMDEANAIEAIQWLADLTNVDMVTPPYDIQRTSLGIGHLFQDGKLAMAFGNHALLPGFAANPDLMWDVVGLPKRKEAVNVAGGGGYVISRQSRNKEAAWTFLQWLENSKGQAIFTETGIAVPSRRSVGQADIFLKQQPPHDAIVFIQETELGRPNPVFENIQAAANMFNDAFVPVWRGHKDAEEAVTEVSPLVNQLLAGE